MNIERFRLGPIEEPVSRRELAVRIAIAAGAVVCLLLAVVLVLLAIDVARVRAAVESGDVRYRASAGTETLWDADEIVPLGVAQKTARDEGRRRIQAGRARVARLPSRRPDRLRLRSRVRDPPQRGAGSSRGGRRSRPGSLASVACSRAPRCARARPVRHGDGGARARSCRARSRTCRRAIALDPTNDEAKHNLELAYQRGRGVQLTEGAAGLNPTPGGSGAKGAGAGQPGTGY